MSKRKGKIKVNTADIFPIIKKWLYSEHDIFLRELVANATDAITKRSTLGRTRNQEVPAGKIELFVNKDEKTIKIVDNGLGMTEEEVEKYIAHLAFSGAEEFIKKLKDQGEKNTDIIGKFGLGFYSSFMVSSEVVIDSLSMDEGAKAVRWSCKGDTDYTFAESDKKEIGTSITLHVNDESLEFLDDWKISNTLKKFCDFMPYKITVLDELKKPEEKEVDGKKEMVPPTPININETKPLWKRNPADLKDEDYIEFFHKLFPGDPDPLFWIHLNVDHPFTLEGILFFPKINHNKPFHENNIRLYCKQVFVSDNVKNIIPEFLSLLKGTIDSVDIPLNVSRSSLQGDPNITKISNYVVKKVADALKMLFKNDRPRFEKIWEDMGLLVKYGCVSETKFDDIMRERVIFKDTAGKYITLNEYEESVPEKYKEKMKEKVLYFEKGKSDLTLRGQLLEEGIQCVEVDEYIDPHFMQHVEMYKKNDKTFKFCSLDSEIGNLLGGEKTTENDIKVKELFEHILAPKKEKKEGEEEKKEEAFSMDDNLEIIIEKLKDTSSPAYFKTDEQMKRFKKMASSMGNSNPFPMKKTLAINPSNPLIQNAYKLSQKGGNEVLVNKLCHHVEDMAYVSAEGLNDTNRENFLRRTQELMQELTNLAI